MSGGAPAAAAQNAQISVSDLPHQAAVALGDVERFIARGTRDFTRANVALFAAGFTTFALIYCVQPVVALSLFASSGLMMASAFAPNWTSLLATGMGLYIGGTGLGALGGRLIVGGLTDLGSWRVGLFLALALSALLARRPA